MKIRWPWAKQPERYENLVSLVDQFGEQCTEWKGFDGPTNAEPLRFGRLDETCMVVRYTVMCRPKEGRRYTRSRPLQPFVVRRYDRPTLSAGVVDTSR